ncbi:MAG TPA: plastocyanin/azurin family copper-binding protein [Actinomycetota bacterium]|nr:plastocyanin/azurin family copper-binding protein [Actinomycetota bacterium]
MTAVRRLPALLVPLALAAVVLAGCGGDEGGGAGAAAPVTGVTEVAAENNHFSPAAIQVPAGTTVTWEFKDRFVPHDVTADGWSSGDPQRSGSYAHTFDQPGTYPYRCTLHDGMTGQVVVTGTSRER